MLDFYQFLHYLQELHFWKNETLVFQFQHHGVLEILFAHLIFMSRKKNVFLVC